MRNLKYNLLNDSSALKMFLLLLSIAAIYILMCLWTPMQYDDYIFIKAYRDFNDGADSFSFCAWYKYMAELRQDDNSRLANLLIPFMNLFSPGKQLMPFASGILCAGIVWMTPKCACFNNRISVLEICISWFMTIVFLPWRNNIFVTDYTSNYVFSAALTLGTILWILRSEKRGWNAISLSIGILLAFLAGGWHEGFAIPTVAGLITYGIILHKRISGKFWIVISFYFISTFLFALSPGMISRFQLQSHNAGEFTGYFKMIADLALVFGIVGITIIALCIRKTRLHLAKIAIGKPWLIIFFIAMLLSAVISIDIHASARTAFYPELCAIICTLAIIRPLTIHLTRKIRISLAILLLALCYGQSIAALIWQHKFYTEDKLIKSRLEASPEGTVFYDILRSEDVPLYTLKFPAAEAWITPFNSRCMDSYFNRPVAVVPTILGDTTVADRKIGDAFLHGNAIWMPNKNKIDFYKINFDIKLSNGERRLNTSGFSTRYISPLGDTLIYVKVFKTDPLTISDLRISSN